MILLLDAGNTRIKWGVRQAGVWLARGVLPTSEAGRLGGSWAAFPLRAALLSCVAGPETRSTLETMLTPRVALLHWLRAAVDAHGVHSDYQPADSLGSDRFAALVAAGRRKLGACLVVNVGTAMTVDALTAAGRFLGGCIVPGPELMRSILLRGTAQVREADATAGQGSGLPRSTDAAVATGIALALAGAVAGMRERLLRDGGETVTLLLSGGARSILDGLLEPPLLEVDDLVLEGLVWIAKDLKWEDC